MSPTKTPFTVCAMCGSTRKKFPKSWTLNDCRAYCSGCWGTVVCSRCDHHDPKGKILRGRWTCRACQHKQEIGTGVDQETYHRSVIEDQNGECFQESNGCLDSAADSLRIPAEGTVSQSPEEEEDDSWIEAEECDDDIAPLPSMRREGPNIAVLREVSRPGHLVFLLDVSGSMRTVDVVQDAEKMKGAGDSEPAVCSRLDAAVSCAAKFVEQHARSHPRDVFSIATFADGAEVWSTMQDATTTKATLQELCARAANGTFYKAAISCATELLALRLGVPRHVVAHADQFSLPLPRKPSLTIVVHITSVASGRMMRNAPILIFFASHAVQVAASGVDGAAFGDAEVALLQQHAQIQMTARSAFPPVFKVFHKNGQRTSDQLSSSTHAEEEPQSSALPEVDGLMEHSVDVYENMGKSIGDLQSRLTKAQEEHRRRAAEKKAKLEEKLRVQKEKTKAIKAVNKKIVREIEDLKDRNADLRARANQISEDTKAMRDQIQVVQGNISSAQEFMDTALKAFSKHFDQSEKLAVLKELDSADTAKARELARERRLAAVSGSRNLSMLEMGSHIHPVAAAHDTLESLMTSLDDLASEQNSSILAVEEAFNKTFHKQKLHQQDLLEEQAQLNATRADEAELNKRLQVAVEHVTKLHDLVKDQLFASVSFMQKVSGDMVSKLKASIASQSGKASSLAELGLDVNRSRPGWSAWLLR